MEPRTITRSVRIDAGVEAVWSSVGDADGLGEWLGAEVDVRLAPGAAGELVDHDGTARRLVVTEVAEGSRLGFVWWDADRPEDASAVTVSVDRDRDGEGAVVTVTETVVPGAVAAGGIAGRACAVAGAEVADLHAAWGLRLADLAELAGRCSPVLVGVGA